MRFQALMPDILHWLGIKKIDRMLSMSNMKHDAIVDTGIKILERIPIPDEMIPSDSRVEIDAKIQSGYFTTGKTLTDQELAQVKGRGWEKWEDIAVSMARREVRLILTHPSTEWSLILSCCYHYRCRPWHSKQTNCITEVFFSQSREQKKT